MMQLQVNPAAIKAVEELVNSKIKQAEVIISPEGLTEVAKAVFTITTKRFLKDLSRAAIEDPKRFHHLYEWSAVGNQKQKLFMVRRDTVRSGKLSISFVPLKSTKPVPIDSRLLEPGPTGKIVSARHIFREKMRVMEEGKPIHFITKRTIAFSPDGNRIVFVPKDNIINIINPGGRETTHALKEFSTRWYASQPQDVVSQSRLIRQIGNEVAKELNRSSSTKSQIKSIIRKVSSNYSKEVTML